MLKNILIGLMSVAMILVIAWMLGPKANLEDLSGSYPNVPNRSSELETYLSAKEDTVTGLKPGNGAKIVWADSVTKEKTDYSIIYIHGFGASEMEGNPVHRNLAAHFDANLYLVRLPEHGIKRSDGMKHLTAQRLMDEVREAYMIGKSLGDSVIVVGTSMGGALALTLASERPEIKALVVYSPAIRETGDQLEQFFRPWSIYLAENYVFENGTRQTPREGEKAKYWSEEYHVNGFVSLAVLIRSKMTEENFKKIKQPLFLGYYFKSDQEQDFVVSVPKMLEMYNQIGTPDSLKVKQAFPESGDHVIASSITSEDWEGVLEETIRFLEAVAQVKPGVEEGEVLELE